MLLPCTQCTNKYYNSDLLPNQGTQTYLSTSHGSGPNNSPVLKSAITVGRLGCRSISWTLGAGSGSIENRISTPKAIETVANVAGSGRKASGPEDTQVVNRWQVGQTVPSTFSGRTTGSSIPCTDSRRKYQHHEEAHLEHYLETQKTTPTIRMADHEPRRTKRNVPATGNVPV